MICSISYFDEEGIRIFYITFPSFDSSMAKHEVTRSHAHRIDLRQRQNEIAATCDDWKQNFLNHPNNSWLCDIPNDYILDRFNTYGLEDKYNINLSLCTKIITGKLDINSDPLINPTELNEQLQLVYGLIHSRFILSPDGIQQITEKYSKGVYGHCPRANCKKENVLPIGLKSHFGYEKIKVFCPCCREIYDPRPKIHLDGAFFGPNMAHLFLDHTKLKKLFVKYEPFRHTAFGFKVRKCIFQYEDKDDGL